MKTPMEEFIEVLKIHRDTAFEKEGINRSKKPFLPANSTAHYNTEYYEGRAKAFEDAISFAEAHLEKEKEVMESSWNNGHQVGRFEGAKIAEEGFSSFEFYFNETFNTKEK